MKVINDTFFEKREHKAYGVRYVSEVDVEIGGKHYSERMEMTAERYDAMYPVLREHTHNTLKKKILYRIGADLFGKSINQ